MELGLQQKERDVIEGERQGEAAVGDCVECCW